MGGVRRLLPDPADVVDIHDEYAVPITDRWWVRMNFVTSADGAVSVDDRSEPLTTPGDHRVFDALRDLADVVLVGAGTIRIEHYRPMRPNPVRREHRRRHGLAEAPTLAVVSGRLDLDPAAPLFTKAETRPIVITHAASPADRRAALSEVADVIVTGDAAVSPVRALTELAERGLTRVLSEGGPHLYATLLAASVVDELCLTVSPLVTGPGVGRIVAGPYPIDPAGLRLTRVLEEDGALFLRYTTERT